MTTITATLILNSILLGVGLAMDAFSVSLANGLNEHHMKTGRMLAIAGTFAGFQFAMPLIGWFCVHTIAEKFNAFQKYIPWIALLLLLYIGGKMLLEGIQDVKEQRAEAATSGAVDAAEQAAPSAPAQLIKCVTAAELVVQGIATSIDALSVGFTIADYNAVTAFISALIIGIVTYAICMAGLSLGRKFGTKLAGKAGILGGVILIGIGIEIWVSGVFL